MIEHDLPLIMSVSDRIVALDVGRVVCEGSAEQVVNDPQVVESYLGANWDAAPARPNLRQLRGVYTVG